eukprot:1159701-Pelagomonas_calceolata.AAC.5
MVILEASQIRLEIDRGLIKHRSGEWPDTLRNEGLPNTGMVNGKAKRIVLSSPGPALPVPHQLNSSLFKELPENS